MDRFLPKIAKYILDCHNGDVKNICIVLPNKRSILFLKKYLSSNISKPILSPYIYSMESFLEQISGFKVDSKFNLKFELFSSYEKFVKEEKFISFLDWCNVILNDFSDIDAYLLDPVKVFKNIEEIAEIENWSLGNDDLTDFQKKYLLFYKSMYDIYTDFNNTLISKNKGYRGLVYKQAYNKIKSSKSFLKNYDKFYFVGLNAFSKAEESIVSHVMSNYNAEIIWDTDKYYMDDEHEAGFFIRKYMSNYKNVKLVNSDYFNTHEKNINIYSCPNNISQVRMASNILQKINYKELEEGSTALVFSDPKYLDIFVNSIPENVKNINISLGKELNAFSFYSVLISYVDLYVKKDRFKVSKYYHKDLELFFKSPIFAVLFQNNKSDIIEKALLEIKVKNYIFLSIKDIKDIFGSFYSEIEFLFQGIDKPQDLIKSIKNMILVFKDKLSSSSYESEILYHYFKTIQKISFYVEEFEFIESFDDLKVLILNLIRENKINFIGQPLLGLQVTELLETRTLDYENVIIIGSNEGAFPLSKSVSSLIPYDVKKFFGMPVYRDRDAVFSYHFYRLIQRATNVHLIYNSDFSDFGSYEKSRFIYQLEHELKLNKNISINNYYLKFGQPELMHYDIEIKKDSNVMKILYSMAERGFSPSSLSTYINCGTCFYFKYILKLSEQDNVEENIESSTLGTIIHESLYDLYLNSKGKLLSKEILDKMIVNYKSILLNNFESFFSKRGMISGKNRLSYEMSKKIIKRFLENEKKVIDKCKIIDLEKELQGHITIGGREVKLKGKIDRIDNLDGFFRIIDYKTGLVKENELNMINRDFDLIFNDYSFSKSFQLYFYMFLFNQSNDVDNLKSGIVSFRNKKNNFINLSDNLCFRERYNDFYAGLSSLLKEILDPSKKFTQSKDGNRCIFCQHRSNFKK